MSPENKGRLLRELYGDVAIAQELELIIQANQEAAKVDGDRNDLKVRRRSAEVAEAIINNSRQTNDSGVAR